MAMLLGLSFSPVGGAPTLLEQLEDEFILVAESTIPTVVTVSVTRRPAPSSKGDDKPQSQTDRHFFPWLHPGFSPEAFGLPEQPGEGSGRKGDRSTEATGSPTRTIGSGVVVTPDGIILTAAHLLKDAVQIRVSLADKRFFKARLIGLDAATGLAVVKIDAQNLPIIIFGDSDHLKVGALLFAVGNPYGLSSSFASGVVSSKGRSQVGLLPEEDYIQTDAPINTGNAGGPLVNIRGDVMGIVVAMASRSGDSSGIGFAVPSNTAKRVMEDLISTGRVQRGVLGLNIKNVDEEFAESAGKADTNGAAVVKVIPNSAAALAGIQEGDIVTEFSGNLIATAGHLRNLVSRERPGNSVRLKVLRQRRTLELNATLRERTEQKPPSATTER